MSDNESIGLIITALLLCCCCLVVIGGGVGVFFFFRNRQKKTEGVIEASVPTMTASSVSAAPPSPAPSPFSVSPAAPPPPPQPEAESGPMTLIGELPVETPPPAEPTLIRPMPGPATPIEADDIRQRLLDLNAPEKSYVVQATGYKLVVAPTAITGYLLEIAFDYTEKVARFVETNAYAADAQLKADVRGVLEGNGWTIRE
jgi:hypothetical protein